MIDEQDEELFDMDTLHSVQAAIAELIKDRYAPEIENGAKNAFVVALRRHSGYYNRIALEAAKDIMQLNDFLYGVRKKNKGNMVMSRALVEA